MHHLLLKKLLGCEVGDDIAPIVLSVCANAASAGSIIARNTHHADLPRDALGVVSCFSADGSLRSVVLRRL